MPEVVIKFNLPEEKEDFEIAMAGIKRLCALDDVSNDIFRAGRKYGHIKNRKLTDAEVEFLGEIEEVINTILREHDL